MNVRIVSWHVPDAQGSAAGRALFALGAGFLADGHGVDVVTWGSDSQPDHLPPWARWVRRPPAPPRWSTVLYPRSSAAALDLAPPDDHVCIADDYLSFPAVARHPRAVHTAHFLTALDAAALRRVRPSQVQDHRGERRVARRAPVVHAYSQRVARHLGRKATFVPIACPVPDTAMTANEDPVAAAVADWRWAPNRWALDVLLRSWSSVRAAVPGAKLVLAGRGLDEVGTVTGVDVRGYVSSATDVLAEAALVAFPCPPSSGPKVKVIEALVHGVPVVTTRAGIEGIIGADEGAVVTTVGGFADAVAGLLRDPARAAGLGGRGRERVAAAHGPLPAARARLAAISAPSVA